MRKRDRKKRKRSVGTQDSSREGKRPRRKTKKAQVGLLLSQMKEVTLLTKALSAQKAAVHRGSMMRPQHYYKKLEYEQKSDSKPWGQPLDPDSCLGSTLLLPDPCYGPSVFTLPSLKGGDGSDPEFVTHVGLRYVPEQCCSVG